MKALSSGGLSKYPDQNNLQKYISFYKCSKDWLLTGREPVYKSLDKSSGPFGVIDKPVSEYNADTGDFEKAVSGLKEIFDSGDPVLIPTTLAGIHAFQISVRREKQIDEQKKECDDLKLSISSLENRLMEGDRRQQVRRQEDLGGPSRND